MLKNFDVIVVGGGHAGIEAAYASARMGSQTLLITLDSKKIGLMPCNPAIGGIGKGHIVFEISALGGMMPKLCTKTYLQARMLNTRKGPAVQGLRLQIDKEAYKDLAQKMLSEAENLTILDGMVVDVILDENNQVTAVKTADNNIYHTKSVVLTTGTFLKGLVHIGHTNFPAGRRDEPAVGPLSEFLLRAGLRLRRLKTGTPPRLLRSSLDFTKMEYQASDELDSLFEFDSHKVEHKIGCYITNTNINTHNIITGNAHLSPIYTGVIKGIPPRYCPSIEDKIARFKGKDSHHVFVEPESASTDEMYPNGLSTAMPIEAQEQFIRSIAGFENAIITKAGYAIEYDAIYPEQLKHSLEAKTVPGLFLAGQINGTTGYEEAAGQGLIAGINAHLKAHNKDPYVMTRYEGYIGIMIDDLVTLGTDEPYRMFTSRAERRLILRQDNVFTRLGETAYSLGLISKDMFDKISIEKQLIASTVEALNSKKTYLATLLAKGEIDQVYAEIKLVTGEIQNRTLQSIYAEILYGPYIEREEKEVQKMNQYQQLMIPENIDFKSMPGLSIELVQKLNKHKPATIAQAALIQGMTPAAISLLIFKVREFTNQLRSSKKEKLVEL